MSQNKVKHPEKSNTSELKSLSDARKERAKQISRPEVLNENVYLVPSQSDLSKKYKVVYFDTFNCECPDLEKYKKLYTS